MALKVGDLYGVLELQDKQFNSSLDGAESSLKDFGAKGKILAAAAGVAIGAALATAVTSTLDVEKATDKLAAQLGLTANESKKAGTVAGNLFSDAYGESMGEVTTAVGAVMSSIKGMRTASEADVEAMTAKVLNLATAFDLDVGRAAQVAGQMITSGLADTGAEAADLLTAALQKVPAGVREDLLDAADEYGPFFANLGLSGEKAMGMLVEASEKGMYGIDKTGDAVKEFSIRATDMSKATGVAYETIGLDQEAMTNKLLAGGDTASGAFQTIVSGLQDIKDPAARSQAALALFGTPLEDLSVNEIPKFLDSLTSTKGGLGDVSGAADKMGQTLNDNAATNLTAFTRGLKTAFVKVVGGMVIPAINIAVQALKSFGDFLFENKGTITTVAGVIGTILLPVLVRLGVQALISAGRQVVAWTMSSGGAIKAAAVYVAQSYVMIGRWVAMGVTAVAQGIKIAAVWTGSIIASAVKGAAAFVVQVARVIAAWVLMGTRATAQGIKIAAVWTAQIVASAVKGAASFVMQTGRVVAGWVLMGAQSLIQAARMAAAWFIALGPVGWVIAAVIGLVALIIANWDKVVSVTKTVFGAVWGFLKGVWNSIVNWIKTAANNVATFVSSGFTRAKSFAISIFTAMVNWVRGVPGKILNGLSGIARFYLSIGRWVLSMKDAAVNKFMSLVGWVRGLPGRILSALGNMGSLLWNAGSQILGGLLNGLRSAWGGITDFVGGIGSWIAQHKGPKRYDMQLLVPAGGWIMGGLEEGLKKQIPSLQKTLSGVSATIENGVSPRLPVSAEVAAHARREALAASSQGSKVVNNTFNTYNPVREPQSQTTERASSHLSIAGGL